MKIRTKLGNSVEDVRIRTMRIFAIIALVSSFLVFLAFSLRLVWQEEAQVESHLRSFKGVAEQFYQLSPTSKLDLSDTVTIYYGDGDFTKQLSEMSPFVPDTVDRQRFEFEITEDHVVVPGIIVYHFLFDYQGKQIPTYITISSFDMDLWDDSWDVLMVISTLLMLFLIIVLRYTLKRVFAQLMTPISDLSIQLTDAKSEHFSVPNHAVDELKQLKDHLNTYSKMKDRLAKQELMFAKYASHELKTPIAIVLGAAELQSMKPEDIEFQNKQRQRILTASQGMKETVEVLLNIVKQENSSNNSVSTRITEAVLQLDRFHSKLQSDVQLAVSVEEDCEIQMPLALIQMVLKNYIENAARFTSSGEIAVEVSSNSIRVTDSGTGLSGEGEGEGETEHGLGLLIVKRIGESYGWESSVRDREDKTGVVAEFYKV